MSEQVEKTLSPIKVILPPYGLCEIRFSYYAEGHDCAVIIYSLGKYYDDNHLCYSGELICKLSVNIERSLPHGQFAVKTYSENATIAAMLRDLEIFEEVGKHGSFPIWKVRDVK